MSKRSPILGYNHNISHRGLVFHVQTEDSGVDNPHVFTHLFHGGVIIFTRRLDYDAGADEPLVKSLMQAQHKAMLKDLRRGVFGDKIDEYLGHHPDLQPRRNRDTIPGGPTAARAAADGDDIEIEAVPSEIPPGAHGPDGQELDVTLGTWPPPSAVSRSEISDVFRVIMQPPPEDDADVEVWDDGTVEDTPPLELPIEVERRGPYGRRPGDEPQPDDSNGSRPPAGATTLRPQGPVPPPPPPPRGEGRVGPRGSGNVLVSRPPIRVDSRQTKPLTPPPPAMQSRRGMAPRVVREDSGASLFDQQTISEKSLDEVILAYLSEDARKDEP